MKVPARVHSAWGVLLRPVVFGVKDDLNTLEGLSRSYMESPQRTGLRSPQHTACKFTPSETRRLGSSNQFWTRIISCRVDVFTCLLGFLEHQNRWSSGEMSLNIVASEKELPIKWEVLSAETVQLEDSLAKLRLASVHFKLLVCSSWERRLKWIDN